MKGIEFYDDFYDDNSAQNGELYKQLFNQAKLYKAQFPILVSNVITHNYIS